MKARHRLTVLLLLTVPAWLACAGKMRTTRFTNPRFDFGFVEKVAVVPFENLSSDSQAGVRSTRLLITELLSAGAVDVVEPGEVRTALGRVGWSGGNPSSEQIVDLGKHLGVQALILGSVSQSETIRSGTVSVPTVTLDVHMVEAETGAAVWAATHTERGAGVGARLLGTGAEPIAQTTRRCVRRIVRTLVR